MPLSPAHMAQPSQGQAKGVKSCTGTQRPQTPLWAFEGCALCFAQPKHNLVHFKEP